jgi:pyruvate,water dikinase
VTAEAPAFPVHFDNPADAKLTWLFSPDHMPQAYSPLGFELALSPFLQGFGWGMRPVQQNYYVYFVTEPENATAQRQATPDAAYLREAARVWNEEALPEVLSYVEQYRTADFDALSDDELIREIERLREVRFRSGQLHSLAVTPHFIGLTLLVDTYKELTGGDELGALRLAQGYRNKSVEAGERLWEVTKIAASLPSVRDALLRIDASSARECLAELERDPAARPFADAFRAYLDEFGWRTGGEFSNSTFAEDPTVPLTMLRTYLELPEYDPIAEQRRLADERDAAIRDTMARLGPAERARLDEVLAAVRGVVTLSEDHNYHIDQRLATLPRRLVLAAGRRLVSKGLLDDPRVVFFLRTTELIDALQDKAGRLQDIAARREEELSHWRTITPPLFVGAPPPEGDGSAGPREPLLPSADGRASELRGQAASAGVARGPVRVLTTLSQAERLRPGDVLVVSVTSPAWTPLFAIASAIVTEVGGVLGHTAVVAREYRLPAVVNVRQATRLLRDGDLVEVDGSAGVVRVLQ